MGNRGKSILTLLSAAALVASAAGCRSSSHGFDLQQVTGTVTYRAKPVAGGQILFVPDNGSPVARATLDDAGRYRLSTFAPGDGAVPGPCHVAVVLRGPDKPVPANRKGQMMEEDMQGSGDPLIPKRYFSVATSDLKAVVEKGKANQFDFALQD